MGFLGRTQYTLGQLPQAQKTLERAIALNQNDTSARLYLGLTLARSDDRQGGLTEIESSMKAIHDFLEYVTQAFRFSFGQYWDPTRQIRSAIESNLAMIRSKEIVWPDSLPMVNGSARRSTRRSTGPAATRCAIAAAKTTAVAIVSRDLFSAAKCHCLQRAAIIELRKQVGAES